jgi:MFS family permease
MLKVSTLQAERVAVSAMFFVNGFPFGSWAVRIPSVKDALELTPGNLGMALLCLGVGALIIMTLIGPAITKYGSRAVTTVFCLLTVVAFSLLAFVDSFWLLIAALLFFGMASGGMDIGMNSNAVNVEKNYARPIMSSVHAIWSFGGMAGAALGGFLASQGWSIQSHFLLVACFSLLIGLVASRFLSKDVEGAVDAGADAAQSVDRSVVHVSLLVTSVVCLMSFVSEGAIADWSTLYLRDVLRADLGIAALGFSSFSFAMAGGRLAGDAVITRFGDAGALLAGGILSLCGALCVVAYPHPYIAIAGFTLAGLGLSVQVPIAFRLAGHCSSRPPGEAIAFVGRAGYFGLLAGPSIFGYVAQLTGLRTALSILILLSLVTMVLALRIRAQKLQAI